MFLALEVFNLLVNQLNKLTKNEVSSAEDKCEPRATSSKHNNHQNVDAMNDIVKVVQLRCLFAVCPKTRQKNNTVEFTLGKRCKHHRRGLVFALPGFEQKADMLHATKHCRPLQQSLEHLRFAWIPQLCLEHGVRKVLAHKHFHIPTQQCHLSFRELQPWLGWMMSHQSSIVAWEAVVGRQLQGSLGITLDFNL